MKSLGSTLALMLLASTACAQTASELSHPDPKQVVSYGMGYGLQRYSKLTGINRENVARLVPVWAYQMGTTRGQQTQPLVYEGVIYVTDADATSAVDALTGRQIWKTKIDYAPGALAIMCCGISNRGAAIYNGKLFRTTLDDNVVALDLKTGKEIWRQKAIDFADGYSMNVAPLIANGVLITGVGGAEYQTRGFLDAYDPDTGKHLWRKYTIPGPGEKGSETWPGDTWKIGGGSTWLTGSYDPDLDLVYWGVGNGAPWNAEARKGDNLYTCSVLAMRPKTGEIVWYYQFSPNDLYDYDGVNELVQADLQIDGKTRKVLMQANRNGFFYVLDRTNGELLAANPFTKVNWADRIDLKTGRPVESDVTRKVRAGESVPEVWPSGQGGKNNEPMSYDPETGLVYANTLNWTQSYKLTKPELRRGTFYLGVDFKGFEFPDKYRGFLKAIDPLTGKSKWEVGSEIPSYSGVLSTAGGLVFTGAMTGEFRAYDAVSGEKLWEFQTGSGIIGSPVAWERDGREYITVPSGIGGVYPLFSGDERLANVPAGGSLWTFAVNP